MQARSRRERLPAAVQFIPIQELHELIDVLLLAVLVIDIKRVLINVPHHQGLPQRDHSTSCTSLATL